MALTEVYIGLGGNLGDPYKTLNDALHSLQQSPAIQNLAVSRFYMTTPVSSLLQDQFLNAVCRLHTSLTAQQLLEELKRIETTLGRTPVKQKDSPRLIDLDILLFGLETHHTQDLHIPHPRWMERLFVLIPLSDLTPELSIPDPQKPGSILHLNLLKYLKSFHNPHNETVLLWEK